MISRRDALKLGAVGVVAPSLGWRLSNILPIAAEESAESVPMIRANAAGSGTMPGPGPRLSEPIIVKWRFSATAMVFQPVVAAGTLYAGSRDGNLYAINGDSGEEIWRFTVPSDELRTPSVVDGIVYVISQNGILFAIEASTGIENWRLSLQNPTESNAVPIIDGGFVYLADGNYLITVDAATGIEIGRFTPFEEILYFSPLAVDNGVIYVASFNPFYLVSYQNFHAVDASSGQELWRYENAGVQWIPTINDGIVYIQDLTNALVAVDAKTGVQLWHSGTGWGLQSDALALANGALYVGGHRDQLYALDAATGHQLWTFTADADAQVGRPVVADSTVYFCTLNAVLEESTLTSLDARLYAIDSSTGNLSWQFQMTPPVHLAHPGNYLSPTVVDGCVYVNSFDGQILALGNLQPSILSADVTLRGAPSDGSIERGTAKKGAEIDNVEMIEELNDRRWAKVTIGATEGWIPLEAIDPETLPPEGKIEYVYIPD